MTAHKQRPTGSTPPFGSAVIVRSSSKILSTSTFKGFMNGIVSRNVTQKVEELDRERRLKLSLLEAARLASETYLDTTFGEPLKYTAHHSAEVAILAYALFSKLLETGRIGKELGKCIRSRAKLAAYYHDSGKRFLPLGLITIGPRTEVQLCGIKILNGRKADGHELDIIRRGHLRAGVEFLSAIDFEDRDLVLSMMRCHHINYDGEDHENSPSYSDLGIHLIGKDLPLHERVMKLCDIASALLPRRYRLVNEIQTLEDSMAFAISVSGTEVDPLLTAHLLAAIYELPLDLAETLVDDGRGKPWRDVTKLPIFKDSIKLEKRSGLKKYEAENRAGSSIDSDLNETAKISAAYGLTDIEFP